MSLLSADVSGENGIGLTPGLLMEEIKRAAPFKFPLPLDADHLSERLRESGEDLSGQALIVLPLLPDEATKKVVDEAIDELTKGLGAPILFLPAINKIKVLDHERGVECVIKRANVTDERQVANAGRIRTVRTELWIDGSVSGRDWRMISRVFGEADCVSMQQADSDVDGR